MAEMVLDCPHCGSERVGFDFGGERQRSSAPQRWSCLLVCRKCDKGIVVELFHYSSNTPPSSRRGDLWVAGFTLAAIYPASRKITAPEHTPDEIAKDYKEAMDNLRRENFTSAGMMFRKVLERSTMKLAPDGGNFGAMTLYQRIDNLAEQHILTPAMKDLAGIIRLEGNQAAHGSEEFDRASAMSMQSFVELFLRYIFTLPKSVEKAKSKSDRDDGSKAGE